jgi:hypothetical protein
MPPLTDSRCLPGSRTSGLDDHSSRAVGVAEGSWQFAVSYLGLFHLGALADAP